MIDLKKVHILTAAIGVLFGVISVIILVYLRVKGVIAVVILWIFVPVLIKMGIDRLKDFRNRKNV